MTELNEPELLDRLEKNMDRLEGVITYQSEQIRQLQDRLSEQAQEIARQQDEIERLRDESAMHAIGQALATGTGSVLEARATLSDIIKEIEYCIGQIQTSSYNDGAETTSSETDQCLGR